MRQHTIVAENSVIALGRSGLKLGFGQIEKALRELHFVAKDRHESFRARLRYLQRASYGITRAGVGRKANFELGDALLFQLGLELQEFGFSPHRLALLINENQAGLRAAVRQVCERDAPVLKTAAARGVTDVEPIILMIFPSALTEGELMSMAIRHGTPRDVDLAGALEKRGAPRWAVLNLSVIVSWLIAGLADGKAVETAPYYSALMEWANQEEVHGNGEKARLADVDG